MSIIKSIIDWASNDLPDWQSDAVRRILTQNEITNQDEDELLHLVKSVSGLTDNTTQPLAPKPLKESHIPGVQFQARKITLKAIKNINNVNAIKNNSSLLFGHKGISVIYGENGAGKSGYARILKRACKAKDSQERILSNVFELESNDSIEATFKISQQNDHDEEIDWKYEEDFESPLSQITVFDSKSANIILDGNNKVTYLPNGAHAFHDLVQILRRLKDKLENEKPTVKKLEFRDISTETEAGKIIKKLTYLTEEQEIEHFAVWDEANEEKLENLRRLIADIELNNPYKQAKKLRTLKQRMEKVIDLTTNIEEGLSSNKSGKIRQAINNVLEAQKAVNIVQENLTKEPLHGVGESAWQILYNSAKDYSMHLAYPDQDFPSSGEESLCVLCMQPLSEEAKSRMERFKNFMENTAKDKEKAALKHLEGLGSLTQKIDIPTLDSIQDILNELDDIDNETSSMLKAFLNTADKRKNEMVQAISNKNYINLTNLGDNPNKDIARIAEDLETEAQRKEKYAHPDSLDDLKSKREELMAKKIFAEKKDIILEHLGQLKREHLYVQCINELNTTAITRKGNTIVSEGLTPRFSKALANELKDLGATHLLLKLKSSGSGGQTKYQLQLQEKALTEKAKLSEILSEGEQRVVALAGFLAELNLGEHECPIVFDDPVTSLDHRYREKIAERLIKESKKRQVIVFTHDLSFLFSLEVKAGESQEDVYFHAQTVRNTGNSVGRVTNSKPWHAMNEKDRISYLNQELETLKGLYQSNNEEYNRKSGEFYGLLRETWESLIERDLLYESVFRFSHSVQTQRLKAVTVTTEDYSIIDSGMSKCSKWMFGHDKSVQLDVNRPDPGELKSDLQALDKFGKALRKRHQETRKERDEFLKPKTPEYG